jgi:hypothetical protein
MLNAVSPYEPVDTLNIGPDAKVIALSANAHR